MKITKFEHACLDIMEGNTRLVIDPGVFSVSFTDFESIDALVITHIHPDHYDHEKVTAILARSPDVQIFTTQEVAKQINSPRVQTPAAGQSEIVGDMAVEFFGKEHAIISSAYPPAQNIGVLVNNRLYYPGDSLTECLKPHEIVAVPTMAPWLKFSEADAFLQTSTATQVFPTHNGFINTDGQTLYDRLFGASCKATGKKYTSLAPGQSLEL